MDPMGKHGTNFSLIVNYGENYSPSMIPVKITSNLPTLWGPQTIAKLVNKSPMNTIVISTINHSYWSYLHQLSYRLGGPTL